MSNLSVNRLFLNLLSAAILNKSLDANLFEGLDAATWKSIEDTARKHLGPYPTFERAVWVWTSSGAEANHATLRKK